MENLNNLIRQLQEIAKKLEIEANKDDEHCVDLCHVLGSIAWETGNQATSLSIVTHQLGQRRIHAR